jgi:hypothetical protein
MLGRPVTQVMYFFRISNGSLVTAEPKNMSAYIHYGSVNTGEEIDSLLRSMTGVFVPLLTQ